MRARIVILGCGFGGLWAAQALREAPAEVIVVDRTNHHLFTPLLCQVATAGLSAPAIAAPIRHILAGQRNATVLLGEVKNIHAKEKQVELDDGARLAYDHLIVATGSAHSYFGNDAGRPTRRGSRRSRTRSRSAAASCSPSSVPSARPMRRSAPPGSRLPGNLRRRRPGSARRRAGHRAGGSDRSARIVTKSSRS